MGKKSSDTTKKIAVGALIAAVAGFLAGILTAPKSGKETRQDIKDNAQKGKVEAEKELKKLHTELNKLLAEAKVKGGDLNEKASKELAEFAEKAKKSKDKAREVLSALHEGNAEDAELNRAIKEAKKSIAHMRKYLKK